MAVRFSPQDVVAAAVASVRMEGLSVSDGHRAKLEQIAAGQVSSDEVIREIVESAKAEAAAGAAGRSRRDITR